MEKKQKLARHSNYQSTQSNISVFSTQSSSAPIWSPISIEQERESEVLTQIQELNKDADNMAEFVCGVNEILCTTIPCIFVLTVLACFQVAMISIGVRFLERCPVAPRVPVFLFVGGCFGLLKALHTLYTVIRMRRHPETHDEAIGEKSTRAVRIVDCALNLFLLTWQIIGTVWTLSAWLPNFDPPLYDPDNWCAQTVYVFALVEIALFGAIVLFRVCFHCGLALCYKYTNIFEG